MKILVMTAVWCSPCKMLKPILEQVSEEHPEVDFVFHDIDSEEGQQLCQQYRVRSVPTIIKLDDQGDLVTIKPGTMTKSEVVSLITK